LASRTGRAEAELIRYAIERLVSLLGSEAGETDPPAPHTGPALVGIGVGPGDAGLVTARAAATLRAADRVLVATTDVRSVGRAEMVVRAVAPAARVVRVPFAIGDDADARERSLARLVDAALAGVDAGELVAIAVIGDPCQWTVFPDVAARVRRVRAGIEVTAEAGITAYQAAADLDALPLGRAGSALVVLDDASRLGRCLRSSDGVVLYKASTDTGPVKAAAGKTGRAGVVAELTGLPGQRAVAVADADDGPLSYLSTVVFPPR
jgi:precorrin-2/cobalt-factor-2 C20-methyltransferase